MSKFDDIFKARGAGGNLPYYEDTHDSNGNFVGSGQSGYASPMPYNSPPVQPAQPQSATPMYAFVPYQQQPPAPQPVSPPQTPPQQVGSSLYTAPLGKSQVSSTIQNQRPYSNMVVYEPHTPEEVQTLIDHMVRHEPAIINLDNVEPDISQRVLDFLSGATYALGGTVNRISGNIFLLSPAGVDVSTLE